MAHLGHALLSLLLLLLLVSEVVSIRHVVKPQDQQQTLQQIASLIKSRGEISQSTIGSGLFRQTLPVLKQTSPLQTAVVNSTVNNDVLEVYVKTSLWGYNILLKLTFWFASPQDTEPQLQLEFNAVTASLASLFNNIRSPATNNTLPAPSFASELNLAGTVDLVLSTVNYNNFKAGLTFSAITTISSTSTSLLPAFATLRGSSAGKIQLNTNIFAPIFSANPTYFTLSLQESGSFALTSAIQCNNYQLNVNVAQQSTITLTTALQIAVKNQAQPLNIGVAANWQSSSSTTSFKGTLTSTWNNAFGLDWLSLSSSSLTLVVGPSVSVNSISFVGQALVSFSNAPSTPAQLSVSLNGNGDYLLSISGVPIGSDLESLYKAVTHQSSKPHSLDGVAVTGSATLTVATYNAGNTKQGFTMTADVSLSDSSSKLYKAAQVLQASPSSITYNFSLYLPIFNAQQLGDFQVKLSESGKFALTSHIQVNNYYISLSVTQSVPTVTITSQITLLTSTQNVPFVINGQFDEQQGSASFTGALNGVWQKAFGLDWLTLNSGTLAIVIGSQTVTSANLNGVAALTFFSSPVNVLFNIKGDGNYAVIVSGLPLGALGSIFTTIAKIAAPSHFNDLSLSGSISFAVSTYASQQAKEGLTVTVQATLASQSSVFYKAAKVLQANPSSQTFVVTVYVPIFQQSSSVTFDLSETGSFSLGKAISVNSYSIDVVVSGSDTSSVNIDAVVAVQPQKQAQPTVFEVTAAFSESAEDVTFTGKLKSSWPNALGLSWLTIQTATLSFTVGSNVNVDNIALTATAALSFSPSPADLQITIKPSGDFSFAVTNVPINSLVFIYHSVTGQNPPQYMWGVSISQGSLSFAVATYNTGTYQAGLTAKATATLLGQQTLTNAARVLLSDPTSETYTVDFFIPIFSANPEYFQLTLSEQGSFSLTNNIQCQSFSLNVDVSSDTRISLSTDLSVTLAKQAQPLVFDITGNFDEQGSVSFTGALQGTWQKPFGLSWLAITDVSINVAIGGAAVESLSLQGTGLITLDNGSERVTLAIQTASNFEDVSLSATVDAQWTFNDFAKSVVGKEIAVLDDLVKQSTASFSVVLSTYNHDSVKSGLSLEAKGNIQGAISKRVSSLSSKEDFNTIVFEIALIIPIFSADPADVSVQLIYDEQIAISSSFFYEGIKFELDTLPLDVSADATFLAKFKKNPDLTFDIGAEVKVDGSALFTGEMIGTWTDVFGWKGFNLSNVIVEFGVNPSMCAVDFCISDLGLGFQMSMGTKTIIFDGNAAAPDYEDLFLQGAVDGKNGMALTMRDVVWEWNEMVPALRIPISDVPDNWGLKDVSFYFAPEDGHFGDIYYAAGFAFKGGITLLDMDLDFAINCTDKTWDFCNFAIHVDLDWDLFKQMIERELRLMNAESSLTVFSIEQLSLTQWSVKNYADQVYPFWDIQIKVLDKVHHLQFRVEQYELASSFSDFFRKWLKSIF